MFIQGFKPIEIDVSETAQELLNHVGNGIATPDTLLAIKLTHRYLKNSPHFLKTMSDIWALRRAGAVVPDFLKDWVKRRQKVTLDYKHPSLARTKEQFFSGDEVPYIYDHDTIHEAVKTFDRPAFELIKKDNADVFCSKERFFSLSRELQLATVVEETMVLSLERYLIPNDFSKDARTGYLIALSKVCTSIASGWWREFAYENYYTAVDMYDASYVDKFHAAMARGEIKPYA